MFAYFEGFAAGTMLEDHFKKYNPIGELEYRANMHSALINTTFCLSTPANTVNEICYTNCQVANTV